MLEKLETKLEAVKKIATALSELDPHDIDDVLGMVSKELGLANAPQRPVNSQAPAQDPGFRPSLTEFDSIEEFITAKAPKTQYQRAACLAYWLERHSGKREININDLEGANTESRAGSIGNMADVVAKAQSPYGYFTWTNKSQKLRQLTAVGKKMVEALPDQKAVSDLGTQGKKKKKKAKEVKK